MAKSAQDRLLQDAWKHADWSEEELFAPQQKTRLAWWFKYVMALSLIILLVAGWSVARADPPPGTDRNSATHKWFEAQLNQNGTSCCSVSDGHVLEEDDIRLTLNRWEVKIDGRWVPVPSDRIINAPDNPTKKTVVWYIHYQDDSGQQAIQFYCLLPWQTML